MQEQSREQPPMVSSGERGLHRTSKSIFCKAFLPPKTAV